MNNISSISRISLDTLVDAARCREPVSGLTHGFYRYPARFSPVFAKAVIEAFTAPGDLVLDPFVGGGTTLVESLALGRNAIGVDISGLAHFVSTVKTTLFSDMDIAEVLQWTMTLPKRWSLRNRVPETDPGDMCDVLRNLNSQGVWRIRKLIQLAMAEVSQIPSTPQRHLATCCLLRTAQWALDSRLRIPTVSEFRNQFSQFASQICHGAREFSRQVCSAGHGTTATCLNRSVIGLEHEPVIQGQPAPSLIMTSPPYPGIHVVYHRWQVRGRRESPAPFWIIACPDGRPSSFYTFGDRKSEGLRPYYANLHAAFTSLSQIASPETLVVQLVSFADASWQLPRYLEVMEETGFIELRDDALSTSDDGRLWRTIPSGKWYTHKPDRKAKKEVVLFHRLTNGR